MIWPSVVANYVVVTPVKDEQCYIARTLESVTTQTVRPLHWVVVDDNSTDGTPEIINSYLGKFEWISCIRVGGTTERKLGSAEVEAFSLGYESVRHLDHDYVVKLDADLSLPTDYFEKMLALFNEHPRLGIASGVYLEKHDDRWIPIGLPPYHAAGAAKMVRLPCYRAIRGFDLSPGWDTADEIKAWANGWETKHFTEIQFLHLKAEGSASGSLRTSYFHGEIYYVCGGGVLFFGGKLLHRTVTGKPFLLAGVMLLAGYVHSVILRRPKLVSAHEEKFYRRLLNRRIIQRLSSRLSPRV
jgi:poly-beta-1,6-N-acetyl-D-glucosamine synthase